MIVSKCHNESVNVASSTDESWYECNKCGRPCETRLSFWIDEYHENEEKKDASI